MHFFHNSSGPRATVVEDPTVYPQNVIETSWISHTQFSHECLILTLDGSSEEPVHSPPSLLPSVTSLSVIKQFCAISMSMSSHFSASLSCRGFMLVVVRYRPFE